MSSAKTYAVGKGKPPVHSRFKKGQSGNPSGKPGPKKAMRVQLKEALECALEAQPIDLQMAVPETAAAEIIKELVSAAMRADASSCRLLFQLIETMEPEMPRGTHRDETAFTAVTQDEDKTSTVSLPQGKTQGSFENGSDALGETQATPDESTITRADAGNNAPAPPELPPYVREKRPTIIVAGQIVQEGD
jgi:hypothetical protein